MEKIIYQIQDASRFILERLKREMPPLGIVLGSGLGKLADRLKHPVVIPTSEIPHWPHSTVQGHAGKLIIGELGGKPIVALQGRVHCYEGYPIQQVIFPIRVLKWSGVKHIIITNAAGGINPRFHPGDFMILTDHINLMGQDPLSGTNIDDLGPRFPDMSHPYDAEWIRIAEEAGAENHLRIHKGVLIGTHGPSYETASEVKMMKILGGDAVCMSTVPEVIAGVHMGLRILGISLITNQATGLSQSKLSHSEVQHMAEKIGDQFAGWIEKIVNRMTV